jgi:PTS system nitrogen regulatory IIA component
MSLISITLDPRGVCFDTALRSREAVIELLSVMAERCYGVDANRVQADLLAREALGSTAFGGGTAIPHARVADLKQTVLLLARLSQPIDFSAHDGRGVDLVFCLLSPQSDGKTHLTSLAEVSRLMRNTDVMEKLRGANSADALYALLKRGNDRIAA